MTRADMLAQRDEIVRAEQDHLLKAAEARGALKLIDLWLARMTDAAPVTPEPAAPVAQE